MPSLDPQAVHCPYCGAEPGKPCRYPTVDHGGWIMAPGCTSSMA